MSGPLGARVPPLVVAVEMGYGHLRPAHALAEALGAEVLRADRPPLARPEEARLWEASRRFYELTSQASQLPLIGRVLRPLLDMVTAIPHLHPQRDLSAPDLGVRLQERLARRGLGRGLVERLEATGAPLLTTYFNTAIVVDRAWRNRPDAPPLYCVATDSDLARAWAPLVPAETRIHYLVPGHRAARRLAAYGVPRDRIEVTGFPLPDELLGGRDLSALRRNLAARLVRLDPRRAFRTAARDEIRQFLGPLPDEEEGRPPLVTYAVGGAGAQTAIGRALLSSLAPRLHAGRIRLALVAGVRPEVAQRFRSWIAEAGLLEGPAEPGEPGTVEVLLEPTIEAYFRRFHRLLAATDVLWTKPSELIFFAALGLPLVLTPPVGVQEYYNRRWAREHGAGLKQRNLHHAADWLDELLDDGTLANTAWSGFLRLPKFGLYHVLERVAPERGFDA